MPTRPPKHPPGETPEDPTPNGASPESEATGPDAAPGEFPALPLTELIEAVTARISSVRYGLWMADQTRFLTRGNTIVLAVRNQELLDFIEGSYGEEIREAVDEVYGPDATLEWVADESLVSPERQGPQAEGARPGDAAQEATPPVDLFGDPIPKQKPRTKRQDPEAEELSRPLASAGAKRRWKSLADFVVGATNRYAYAAAMSVVEHPGEDANPLVIHGPVGTGKTHLLEGIQSGLKRLPDFRPIYVTAEQFTTRFVQSSKYDKMSLFRREFREANALLLDDLHFLATRKGTQAEFLHTFDSLVAMGRQVVVSMDCHPQMADELMPELRDRLLGGAIWPLLPPDFETRLEILRKIAGAGRPPIPDSVLRSIAQTLKGNVRELEGSIKGLRLFAKVGNRPIDAALAQEALSDLMLHSIKVTTMADVDAAVCRTLQLSAGSLQSKSRNWSVTHPRMVAIYLCRKHTGATYGDISKYFGAKTHSGAVAAEKKVRGWIEKNQPIAIGERNWPARELIERIERILMS